MYQVFKLDNGIRVALKKIKELRSVSFGLWIDCGSSNEELEMNGMSHFIEHMLFKGTKNRTPMEIVSEIDDIGGELNAFTSKECTCYYSKVLDTHIEDAMDVISDMIENPLFSEEEIEKEKQVIYDEIDMYDDNPEEVCYDLAAEITYGNKHYGNPILGQKNIIEKFNRNKIIDFYGKYYHSDNMVISISGNYDVEIIKGLLNKYFNKKAFVKSENIDQTIKNPLFSNGYKSIYKDTEQVHVCIGFRAYDYLEPKMYPLILIDNYLGGAASSKFFQNIREKYGLAYGIYSFVTQYKEAGIFNIYFSVKKESAEKVMELIKKEIEDIKEKYIDESNLLKLKEQIKGSYILGLESPQSFMEMMGKAVLASGKIKSEDQVINLIDNVTVDDIREVVNEVFDEAMMNMAVVGNIEEEETERLWRILNDRN